MANDSFSLLDLLRKSGMDKDADFLRDSVRALSQALIELEASEKMVTSQQVVENASVGPPRI